jgi:hypothetical protein
MLHTMLLIDQLETCGRHTPGVASGHLVSVLIVPCQGSALTLVNTVTNIDWTAPGRIKAFLQEASPGNLPLFHMLEGHGYRCSSRTPGFPGNKETAICAHFVLWMALILE